MFLAYKLIEKAHVGKLILAARYLDIQPLLDLLCDHYSQRLPSTKRRIDLRSCSSSRMDVTMEGIRSHFGPPHCPKLERVPLTRGSSSHLVLQECVYLLSVLA